MAGDWIKMRTNLWDDPRISKLCDITDQPEAAIVGGLYWLWATADDHTECGVLHGLTTRAIDRKTGIQGLGEGLVAIGWLADHPEGVRIIGFEEHNGSSAKKRCQTAKRVEKHKAENAPLTQQALPDNADSVSGALPREEKRREESKALATDESDCAGQPEIAKAKADPIPYEQIFDAYSQTLPELPQVRIRDEARRKAIRSLWRSDSRFQSVDFWGRYYGSVRNSRFLMGMNAIGFDWLMKPANFKKVVEGNYQ